MYLTRARSRSHDGMVITVHPHQAPEYGPAGEAVMQRLQDLCKEQPWRYMCGPARFATFPDAVTHAFLSL